MNEIFDACRWVNQFLGVAGCVCVLWRLIPLLLDRARWRDLGARHRILVFMVLAGFELLSAVAAIYYDGVDHAHWFSAGFTALHASVICLCVWWPHPTRLPRS